MTDTAKMPDQPGEITITLDGKDVVLRASLRAARSVNTLADGFAGAYQGLSRFNLDTFAIVIGAATNKRTNAQLEEIQEQVYKTGLETLVGPLTRYVTMLANGGREPKGDEPSEPAKETSEGNE